jgi:hypothetical protein
VHLDLKGGPEQLDRLLRAGAVRVDIGQGEVDWEVLADPEGNEFCLQPESGPELGSQPELGSESEPGSVADAESQSGSASGSESEPASGSEPQSESGSAGGLRWSAICQDAADPAVQAGFWATAGGLSVVREGDWGVAMGAGAGTGPLLVMGPPQAAKQGPNRLYLSIEPHRGSDVVVESSRLVLAGARRQEGDALLIDPEGNEFGVEPAVDAAVTSVVGEQA